MSRKRLTHWSHSLFGGRTWRSLSLAEPRGILLAGIRPQGVLVAVLEIISATDMPCRLQVVVPRSPIQAKGLLLGALLASIPDSPVIADSPNLAQPPFAIQTPW